MSVVGAGMKSHPGVAATVFETLAANGINIEMISTSAIRISCVVAEAEVEQAVLALHDGVRARRTVPRTSTEPACDPDVTGRADIAGWPGRVRR